VTKAICSWPRFVAPLVLAFMALSTYPAAAHYREACWVKVSIDRYAVAQSPSTFSNLRSPVYAVGCNYLTGQELNSRSGRQKFANDRVYVVIVWPNSERSYIRINQPIFFCGSATEPGCAERTSGRLTGHDHLYDRYGRVFRRTWQICQPGFVGRNCYRMLGGEPARSAFFDHF
jgi:hypothetical protein